MILNIVKLIIFGFLFASALSFANEIALCKTFYMNILYDKEIKNFEDRLNAWKEHEQECSSKGAYKLYLADLYYTHGFFQEALNILESEILTTEYDIREHQKLLCAVYHEIGYVDKLKILTKELIAEYPDWCGGYICQGHLYSKEKNWQAAMNNYAYSTVLNSSYVDTFLRLTVVAYELENYRKSAEYYIIATSIEPIRALTSCKASAIAIISGVKSGMLSLAKDVIEKQQLDHENTAEYELFQKAKLYYEQELEKTKG